MKNNRTILNKLSIQILSIAMFTFLVQFVSAQENSISPIFGISESSSSFENDLVAINQISGVDLIIESFSSTDLLAKNYTISTQQSSNVDQLFIQESNNSLLVYDLPYFFDPHYVADKSSMSLSVNIDDIDYHHLSSSIYSYNIFSQELYSLSTNSGAVQSTTPITFNSLPEHFSIKTNEEYVVLSGQESGDTKLLFHHIDNNTNQEITLSTQYKELHIVSNANLSMFYAVAKDLNDINWLLEIDPVLMTADVVSGLPSCSDCTTENFNYDKNAITLDWENENMILVLNQINGTNSNYSLLTIDLSNGEVKQFSSLDREMSNLYFNKAASDLVFPGDANHDGLVNTRDLLPIGLRYSFNTVSRFTQNIDWIGQHSFNTGVMAQGVDVKHADCNGDGQINTLDVEAIKINYSSVHNSSKSESAASVDCDYPLGFSFIETAYQSDGVVVNIKLGETFDPVIDVYGVSFTISYDNSFVVANSMTAIGMNSWFGNDGANSTHLAVDDFLNGRMDVTLTGLDLLNRSGGGDIIQIAWTMEDDLVPIAQQTVDMNLRIEDVYIINFAEQELDACGPDTSLVVNRKDAVGIITLNDNYINIYPNPVQETLNIETEEIIESVELLTISGKKIKALNFENKVSVDVSTVSKGVYLLQFNTLKGTYFEKIVID